VRATAPGQRAADIFKISRDIDDGEIPGDLIFPLMARLKKLNCKGCEGLSDVVLACLAGVGEEEEVRSLTLHSPLIRACTRVRVHSRVCIVC
jgi:hypothetical protein